MRERQHRMAPKIFVQEPLAQFPDTSLPTVEKIKSSCGMSGTKSSQRTACLGRAANRKALLSWQQAEASKLDAATRLRRPTCVRTRLQGRGQARTGRTFGGQVSANLPVRRSASEGGKELGYGG